MLCAIIAVSARTQELEPRAWLPIVRLDRQAINGDFENGTGGTCERLSGPIACYQEQIIPADWIFGWHEHAGPPLCNYGLTGRPEANLSDRRHPDDVWSDEYSAHAFVYWRCARFWWRQTVNVLDNRTYTVSAMARTWPGNPWMEARLCVSGICTSWLSTDGHWVRLEMSTVIAVSTIEIRLECRAVWPDGRHNDCWFDLVRIK